MFYGFSFPVVYILMDFFTSKISSSSSFYKKGPQLLHTRECLSVAFILEGILVEYFSFRSFELLSYCFLALIVLLWINLRSTFFFLMECWFAISLLAIVFWIVTHRQRNPQHTKQALMYHLPSLDASTFHCLLWICKILTTKVASLGGLITFSLWLFPDLVIIILYHLISFSVPPNVFLKCISFNFSTSCLQWKGCSELHVHHCQKLNSLT